MPRPKRPLKVFLCHAHADRDAVRALYTRLTKDGVDVWLDKENLLPGQDWELEIKKAVREADVVVVCLSKQFNQAGFRQKEVRIALEEADKQPDGEIFIIPVRLEDCEIPENLSKWHIVDLFNNRKGYFLLMTSLMLQIKVRDLKQMRYILQKIENNSKDEKIPLVKDLMFEKIIMVDDDSSLANANMIMKKFNISVLPVVPKNENGRLTALTRLSILSAVNSGKSLYQVIVRDYSSFVDVYAETNWTIVKAVREMIKGEIDYLPVINNKHIVVGLLTSSLVINYYNKKL